MAEAVTITPGDPGYQRPPGPEVGTWAIDPSHASFEFVARHLMAKVRGRFTDVSGEAQHRGPRGVVAGDRDRRLHHRHQGC
jgi:hypothetical protein